MSDLPRGPFSIIYADPPWRYDDRTPRGGADRHYPTMTQAEMEALPVAQIAAPVSALFLWSTWPLMPRALYLMGAWGFTFKTVGFVWVKRNPKSGSDFVGLGHWTRGNTEACLLGLRGRPKRISKAVRQLVVETRREHSAKPTVVRDRIVSLLGDLPRLEMFARTAAPGWTVWGDEAPTIAKGAA